MGRAISCGSSATRPPPSSRRRGSPMRSTCEPRSSSCHRRSQTGSAGGAVDARPARISEKSPTHSSQMVFSGMTASPVVISWRTSFSLLPQKRQSRAGLGSSGFTTARVYSSRRSEAPRLTPGQAKSTRVPLSR